METFSIRGMPLQLPVNCKPHRFISSFIFSSVQGRPSLLLNGKVHSAS